MRPARARRALVSLVWGVLLGWEGLALGRCGVAPAAAGVVLLVLAGLGVVVGDGSVVVGVVVVASLGDVGGLASGPRGVLKPEG